MKTKIGKKQITDILISFVYMVFAFLISIFLVPFVAHVASYIFKTIGFLQFTFVMVSGLFLILFAVNFVLKTKKHIVFLALYSFIGTLLYHLYISLLTID